MTEKPNGLVIITLAILSGLSWAYYPNAKGMLFIGVVGTVCGFAAAILTGFYIAHRLVDIADRANSVKTMTTHVRAIEAAAKLTDAQAEVVKVYSAKTEIGVTFDAQWSAHLFLMTVDGKIPLDWIEQFLKSSGVSYLPSIRQYSEGTHGYDYARSFTTWAINSGFAIPSVGPHPAQWLTVNSKNDVMQLFGFEADLPPDLLPRGMKSGMFADESEGATA